jgi:hypothetical protein
MTPVAKSDTVARTRVESDQRPIFSRYVSNEARLSSAAIPKLGNSMRPELAIFSFHDVQEILIRIRTRCAPRSATPGYL